MIVKGKINTTKGNVGGSFIAYGTDQDEYVKATNPSLSKGMWGAYHADCETIETITKEEYEALPDS